MLEELDSSVAAVLLNRVIGKNLTRIFVDHGGVCKNEFKNVMHDYECSSLNVIGVDASGVLLELEGVTEPERKRKIIGKGFIDVFDEEAHKLKDVKWLGSGYDLSGLYRVAFYHRYCYQESPMWEDFRKDESKTL